MMIEKGKKDCKESFETDIEKLLVNVKAKDSESFQMVTPWQEKISNKLLFGRSLIFWILFGQIIFLIQYLLVTFGNGSTRGLPAFGIYCVLIIYAGYLPKLNARKLELMLPAFYSFIELDSNKIKIWYIGELQKIFSFRRNLWTFIFLGIPLVLTLLYVTEYFQYTEPWFSNKISDIYGIFAFTLWCFIVTPLASFVLSVISFFRKLSKLPIRVTVHQHPYVSVKAVGRLMFFISMHLMLGLILIYTGIFFAPISVNWLMLIWIVFGGILVLIVFILPQLNIHRMMVNVKYKKIKQFSEHLEKALGKAIDEPSNENIERFEKLFTIQEHLNKMSEWPFNAKALITLISTIIIPIIIALIELLIK